MNGSRDLEEEGSMAPAINALDLEFWSMAARLCVLSFLIALCPLPGMQSPNHQECDGMKVKDSLC